MRRTVLASTTKFCPSFFVGVTSSRAARERISAAPSSVTVIPPSSHPPPDTIIADMVWSWTMRHGVELDDVIAWAGDRPVTEYPACFSVSPYTRAELECGMVPVGAGPTFVRRANGDYWLFGSAPDWF